MHNVEPRICWEPVVTLEERGEVSMCAYGLALAFDSFQPDRYRDGVQGVFRKDEGWSIDLRLRRWDVVVYAVRVWGRLLALVIFELSDHVAFAA